MPKIGTTVQRFTPVIVKPGTKNSLEEISVAQAALADDFETMFDSTHPLYESVRVSKEIAKQLDEARVIFVGNSRFDFYELS